MTNKLPSTGTNEQHSKSANNVNAYNNKQYADVTQDDVLHLPPTTSIPNSAHSNNGQNNGTPNLAELDVQVEESSSSVPPFVQPEPTVPPWTEINTNIPHDELEKLAHREDSGMAELVRLMFGDRICYDLSCKRWYVWMGHYWQYDESNEVRRAIRQQLPLAYDRMGIDIWDSATLDDKGQIANAEQRRQHQLTGKQAKKLRKNSQFKNIYDVLLDAYGISGNDWDTNPYQICCPNGTIEISADGVAFCAGLPSDHNRTVTNAEWRGLEESATLWERVVNEAMLGDKEKTQYLHSLLGYAVLGIAEQHVFPCLVGDGRNGKTVIIEALQRVLGGYAHTGTDDLVILKGKGFSDAASPSLAALQGKRFVTVSETREGAILNTAQVKNITGGDSITARMLNSNPVTFTPSHTLFLITNHKPHIRSDDYAAWRRVKAVEFNATFVNDPTKPNEYQIDESIPEQLKAEDSGILASLVRSAHQYLVNGRKLIEPKTVNTATNSYRDSEDTVLEFVNDICIRGDDKRVKCTELYDAYKCWVIQNGYGKPMSNRSFARRIAKMGYERVTGKGIRKYKDIGLMSIKEEMRVH